MCFIPGADPISASALKIIQGRDARKQVESQNQEIVNRQSAAITKAEQATVRTTGSGDDPAQTLANEIKQVKAANELATTSGFETKTPFTGLSI